MKKRVLSIIICLIMLIGIIPITASAAYCPDCGEQFDSGEYCPECYRCHGCCGDYCLICGKCDDCSELCDRCGEVCIACHEELGGSEEYSPCPDCGKCKEGVDYCLICGRCEDCCTMCDRCGEMCIDCHESEGGVEEYNPCPSCGRCKEGVDYCLICGTCADCCEICDRCGEVCLDCHADFCGVDEYEACYNCGKCKQGVNYCTLCGLCEECGEICENCMLCTDCSEEQGFHCPECGECYSEVGQCPSGYDHCFEHCILCDNCGECFVEDMGSYCENCGLCIECAVADGLHCSECGICESETEFCPDCGLCVECAVNEGLHCAICENCYESYDECEDGGNHCVECCELCDECGKCCLEDDTICGFCNKCTDCCLKSSNCINGMCCENPKYKNHFCTVCGKCFDEVYQCTTCSENGVYKCIDCCEHSEIYNCTEHKFNSDGVCTVCGYKKAEPTAKPVFTIQPKNAGGMEVYDVNDPDLNLDDYIVTFRVAVDNQTGVTYKWQYSYSKEDWFDYKTDNSTLCSEANKNILKVIVLSDACYSTVYVRCIATNKFGSTVSNVASISATHHFVDYTSYDYYGHYVFWEVAPDDSSKHMVRCCGEGCEEYLESSREDHTYGEWIVLTPSTATTTGLKKRTCTKCGFIVKAIIPKEHTCEKSNTVTNGTVTKDGQTLYVHGYACTICGEFIEYEEHTLTQIVDTPATETALGSGHYYCSVCGYTKNYSIPKLAHTHDYLKSGYKAFTKADYQKYGTFNKTYHWSICLDKTSSGKCRYEHSKAFHTYGELVICGNSNYMYRKCTVCGYCQILQAPERPSTNFIKISVINAKLYVNGTLTFGMAYVTPGVDKIKVVADIKDVGKTFNYWTSNNTIVYTDKNSRIAYGNIVTAGIITSAQSKKATLEFTAPNNDVINLQPVLQVCPHSKTIKLAGSDIEATCTQNGKDYDTICTNCRQVISYGKIIQSTGHNYIIDESTVVKATCKNRGYSGDVICTKCGERYKGSKAKNIISGAGQYYSLDLNNHNYDDGKVTVSPTCKSTGIKTCTCVLCGANKVFIISKTTVHSWDKGKINKNATCKETGIKTYTCTVCGITKTETVAKLTAHTYDSGVITKKATCKDTGIKTYTCTVCGITKTETVAKLTAHTYDSGVITKKATCKEAGVKTYTCTVCGATKTESITKLTTHTYDSGVITKKATCKETGVKTYTCTVCGITKTESITKLTTHTYDSGVITKKATCKDTGIKTYTCTVCGITKTEVIPKDCTNHTGGTEVRNKTLTYTGDIYCLGCNEKLSGGTEVIAQKSMGELTGDGKVNAKDARLLLRYTAKLETLTDEQLKLADVNNDGKVNAKDARKILRVSAKLETF